MTGGDLAAIIGAIAPPELEAIAPAEQTVLFLRGKSGAPGGIRTPDRRVRSPVLYPAELQARDRRFVLYAILLAPNHLAHVRLSTR